MKKFFVFMVLAVVLMSGAAMATQSRIAALGRYTAPYICDDYNVFTWYATLPSYSNLMMVGMEIDGNWEWEEPEDAPGYWWFDEWTEAYFGLTYGLGDEGKWGTLAIVLRENTEGPNIYGEDVDGAYFGSPWDDKRLFSDELYNRYTLMYGYALEKMSFGLFFSRASVSTKHEWTTPTNTYTNEDKNAYTTIGVGARIDIGESMTADAAFDMTFATYEDAYTDELNPLNDWAVEDDANKAMNFRGRLFYEWNENITFVPYFAFNMADFSRAWVETTGPAEEMPDYYGVAGGIKTSLVKFGIAADLTVNEDNLIIFGVEPFSLFKAEPSIWNSNPVIEDYSAEVKARTMPRFILALESDVTDWMTFRSGCSQSLMKFTLDRATGEDITDKWETTEDYFDFFSWNLGLGFHFGDFDIDCVIQKSVPFSMGYWLTGFQQSDNSDRPISMISALYHF